MVALLQSDWSRATLQNRGATSAGLCKAVSMQRAFGLAVPETVAEMCRPERRRCWSTTRRPGSWRTSRNERRSSPDPVGGRRGPGGRCPVFYVRHVSLPPTHLGVGALRTAMAWQRGRAEDVTSAFPPDAAHTRRGRARPPRRAGVRQARHVRARRHSRGGRVARPGGDHGDPRRRGAGDRDRADRPACRRLGFLPVVVDDACGIVNPRPLSGRSRPWTTRCLVSGATAEEVAAFACAAQGSQPTRPRRAA